MSLIDITHHQQPIVVSLASWFRTACKHTESLLLDLSNLEFTRKPGVSDLVSNMLESGKCNLKTLFNKLTAEDLMKPDVFKKDERIWPLGWEHIFYLI